MPSLVPLALALLAQTAPADPVAAEITLEPEAPLAALLVNPSGASGRARSSTLINIVQQQVAAHTDLFVRWLDPVELASCEGRLACITLQARPDYDRLDYELGNGTMAPFSEHQAHVRRKRIRYPTHLLLLSHVTGDAKDRLSVRLVHTDRALARIHATDLRAADATRTLEVALRAEAMLAEPQWGEIEDDEGARNFLEGVFANHLRRPLEDAGHWEPQGSISVEGVPSGLGIGLDGATIGTTAPGLTRIRGVPAGEHTLRLFGPDRDPFETTVVVERRQTSTVRPDLSPARDPTARAIRQGTIWGGASLVVAGAIVGGVALARVDGNVGTLCPGVDGGGGCDQARFASTGYDPSVAPSFDEPIDAGGVLLGPLGYSLALTGATWALGTWLFGDQDSVPWWQLAAGVVAGGVAYGLSAALQPASPYDP